ncbi:hypothetical protein DPMN_106237 [Dreissena polymorpha]|uniref:Uncharacterized protein n=1 Tax=Dreissena polymorpha TaxID=45954 RepID=A0A9D4K4L5_DREPO|nr:hypothetical protein DPMN_106237 [Dreissena polymorpha]
MQNGGETTMTLYWFGLLIYQDATTTKQFIKATSGQTIGDVVRKHVVNEHDELASLEASKSMIDTDKVKCDPTMPVNVLVESDLKCIHAILKYQTPQDRSIIKENAFDVLMAMRRNYCYLPSAR